MFDQNDCVDSCYQRESERESEREREKNKQTNKHTQHTQLLHWCIVYDLFAWLRNPEGTPFHCHE